MDLETLLDLLRTYLTIQFGPVSLGPVETSVFVLALTAAFFSAFYLYRILTYEDREDRLALLRGLLRPITADRIAQRDRPGTRGSGI